MATFAACILSPTTILAKARPIEIRVVVITTWEVIRNGKDLRGEQQL